MKPIDTISLDHIDKWNNSPCPGGKRDMQRNTWIGEIESAVNIPIEFVK